MMPTPDMRLVADDQLIAISPTEGLARLQLAMYSTVEQAQGNE